MSKEDMIELEGVVVEALPNAMFKVEHPGGTYNPRPYIGKAPYEFHTHTPGR